MCSFEWKRLLRHSDSVSDSDENDTTSFVGRLYDVVRTLYEQFRDIIDPDYGDTVTFGMAARMLNVDEKTIGCMVLFGELETNWEGEILERSVKKCNRNIW